LTAQTAQKALTNAGKRVAERKSSSEHKSTDKKLKIAEENSSFYMSMIRWMKK
jgi:hypothetical protein